MYSTVEDEPKQKLRRFLSESINIFLSFAIVLDVWGDLTARMLQDRNRQSLIAVKALLVVNIAIVDISYCVQVPALQVSILSVSLQLQMS